MTNNTSKEQAISKFFQTYELFHHAMMKQQRELPLSISQMISLIFIAQNPNSSLKDIAKYLSISNASASVFTQRLEDKKMLNKKINPHNKRSMLFTITSQGQKMIKKNKEAITKKNLPFLSQLSLAEIEAMIKIFNKIIRYAKK